MPDVDWALTGSMSFALQGVPVDPSDVDVQTDEPGPAPSRQPSRTASSTPSSTSRASGSGRTSAVDVEIIGALRKRREDGTWELPVDVTRHRRFVTWRDREVPVLSLSYEADAYERLGRTERAAPLREHTGDED